MRVMMAKSAMLDRLLSWEGMCLYICKCFVNLETSLELLCSVVIFCFLYVILCRNGIVFLHMRRGYCNDAENCGMLLPLVTSRWHTAGTVLYCYEFCKKWEGSGPKNRVSVDLVTNVHGSGWHRTLEPMRLKS